MGDLNELSTVNRDSELEKDDRTCVNFDSQNDDSDLEGDEELEEMTDEDDVWDEMEAEEPELEFDYSGTELAGTDDFVKDDDLKEVFRDEDISPEGLIEEDYEQELGAPAQEDQNDPNFKFRDIAKYGILQVAGDDYFGRRIIVFSSCLLPPRTEIDHNRLLQYLKFSLDQYVENDYALVYFHHGLNSSNKPGLKWLRQAYKEFDRKYKKNLKALYLVHPTNFIKILWSIFQPIISAKFGRKVKYINYLFELAQDVQLDQITIPQKVLDHDIELLAKEKPVLMPTSIVHAPLPRQQFGVSLEYLKNHSGGRIIPQVVAECIISLRKNGMMVEDIFRRSANTADLRNIQQLINEGSIGDFETIGDPHLVASLLKSFLRQLPEPLLTYDLYDHIVAVQDLQHSKRFSEMRRLLHDELPDENYYILKFIIQFLNEVAKESAVNKMTAENLGVVFGANLAWPTSRTTLTSLRYLSRCAEFMIDNYSRLFSK